MKLVSFLRPSEASPRVGVLLDDRTVVDAAEAWQAMAHGPAPHLASMLAVLDRGPEAFDDLAAVVEFAQEQRPLDVLHALDRVRLCAPVPRPRSIRDCMVCEGHVTQAIRAIVKRRRPWIARADAALARIGRGFLRPPAVWYRQPIYYKGNPHSVVGHGADVRWPVGEERLDYELEFGIFIGRTGRDIPASQAASYIAGYTIFNDFSARDLQLREMAGRLGPAKGKDFDTGNAMGPWLVTPDEVPNPRELAMLARVNGEVWSRGRSDQMRYSFEELIEYISRNETLHPGEFIGSGAVTGGCGLELDRWLRPGDVVELEVERLGVLRNRVVRERV